MSLRTPLFEDHLRLGARMVEFAGWQMPIQYKGLREEHNCVRQNVGLFDVSHMGEIRFKGPKSLDSLNWLTTNNVEALEPGQAQYSLLPNDRGGLVDDIIVYCLEKKQDYLVCVNASNTEKDFMWMQDHNRGAEITNESLSWGQIAVQGPKAVKLLDKVLEPESVRVSRMTPFSFIRSHFKDYEIIVATTGYTGEKGCEIFIQSQGTSLLWNELLANEIDFGVQPIGLGARDTLRTEMKYSLYGHEIDDTTNPFSAGLGWVIKSSAKDFIGKDLFLNARSKGLAQFLIGFKMLEKGIPRQGYSLFSFDNHEIGRVTSGTHSPTLDEPIGIGYIDSNHKEIGSEFWVDIRGRKIKAVVCKTPFVVPKSFES